TFKIKTDSDAFPKTYSIDTKIRYENSEGDIKYSDTFQGVAIVKQSEINLEMVAIGVVVIILVVFIIFKKKHA
ncbi:MAG: hypothetical protein ACE5NG_18425, partial [bacterium]